MARSGSGHIILNQPEILKFFINGVEYTDHVTNYEFVEQKNNLTSFSASLVDIGVNEKNDVKRGSDIQFRYGSVLIYKCRIEKCDYKTNDFADISGYDTVQSILKSRTVNSNPGESGCDSDSDEGRPVYSGTLSGASSQSIVAGQLSGISNLVRVGTNNYLGHVVARADFDNILAFEDGMVRNLSGVWWSSYGSSGVHTYPYTTNHFNVDKAKTNSSVAYSFYLSGDFANATETSREIDEESLATSVVMLGVGNGQNQLKSRCFHATDNWTRLSNFVSGVQTTAFNVDDASVLPASGTVWCGLEKVVYTGKSSNTLTGITRGKLDGFDSTGYTFLKCYDHSKGVAVYDTTYTEINTDGNSKIDSLGLHKATFTDQRVIDQDALDLMATNALIDNWYLKERIKLIPVDLYDCLQNILVGSTVYIQDTESGLDGNYEVVGQTLRFNEGLEELEYEVSNYKSSLTQDLQGTQQKVKVGSQYMTGSSTIFQVQSYENCDSQYIAKDSFEDGNYTSYPTWTKNSVNNDISIQTTVVKNGNYAIQCHPDGGGTGHEAYATTPVINEDLTTEWTCWFYFDDCTTVGAWTDYAILSSLTYSAANTIAGIRVYSNKFSVIHGGGYSDLSTTPSANNWYKIKIVHTKNASTADYYLYDSSDSLLESVTGKTCGTTNDARYVVIGSVSDTNFNCYFDDVTYGSHKANYLDLRFYLPPEVIKVSSAFLSCKTSDYRAYNSPSFSGSFGIDTSVGGSDAVLDIDIGPDGGTLNRVKTDSTGETGLEITEWITSGITLGGDTGNWLDIRFTPDKPTRVEANLFAKVFIHS